MTELTMSDIDPFDILKKEKMSLEKLHKVYKKLLVRNHPDKGGRVETFHTLVKSYDNITKMIEYQDNNKNHSELKQNFEHEYDNSNLDHSNNESSHKDFNNDQFNKAFNKFSLDGNRLINNDDGYGEMMVKSDKEYKEIDVNNFIGKYNKNSFDTEFKKKIKKINKSVTEYKPPEALESNKINYQVLGEEMINDYTDTLKNTFTDYKKAYDENNFFDADNVKYNEYSSVEEIEKVRKNNIKLTEN
jgi:hypothetical protein